MSLGPKDKKKEKRLATPCRLSVKPGGEAREVATVRVRANHNRGNHFQAEITWRVLLTMQVPIIDSK